MTEIEVLDKLRVYPNTQIYQLGCTATVLNIHAQQQRAFNLVWALLRTGRAAAGTRVAVIGAGMAGLSVASALAAVGAIVRIYDSKASVMHLQAGNLTRFLHPSIALWPDRSFGYPLTNLPFLNWRAESAAHVEQQLLKQWRVHRRVCATSLEVRLGCSVKEVLVAPENPAELLIKRKRGVDRFDVVILAVGYGVERPPLSDTPSYWRNDDLAQPVLLSEKRKRFLVSGTGDGGLLEVLRLTVEDFHHQRFIQAVMYDEWLFRQARGLLKRMRGGEDASLLWANFLRRKRLPSREPSFLKLKRADTTVYLNATRPFPSRTNAQLLHRLCVALLIRTGIVKYIPGHLIDVFINNSNEYVALIRDGKSDTYLPVDVVIERHDASPTISRLFPKDNGLLSRLRSRWENTDDESWQPQYESGFLGDEFQRSHLERGYKIGFLLPDENGAIGLRSTLEQIFQHLDFQNVPNHVQAWANSFDRSAAVREVWQDRAFTLSLEECNMIEFGGLDPPQSEISWRIFASRHLRWNQPRSIALFLNCRSRQLIDHLLRQNDLPYHILRIFPANTFETYLSENFPPPHGRPQPRPTPFVSLDTNVFLITWDTDRNLDVDSEDDFFEVHCRDGMLQAHVLLRLPVLLELLMNAWPTTKAHGMGWAIRRSEHLNRTEHDGNRLLEWNP